MQRLIYDVVVVGGGIIGAATARELMIRNLSLKIAIIEKEKCVASHQSGHNSGVMHTGIYYTPGTLKARLCVEGVDLAYRYCSEKNIPFKKCGKLIVAVTKEELKQLDSLYQRALANKVKDVFLIDKEKISEMEPHIRGLKAIWSPNTGIVDWAEVTRSFVQDCREMGADLYLDFSVKGFHLLSRGEKKHIVVHDSSREILTKCVVTCGGLHSDRLSGLTQCSREPRIVPFRGDYLVLKPEKSHLVKTNIYPVPNLDLPFLGVHITPRMDGSMWLGPNAVLAFHREGYKLSDFDNKEVAEFLKHRGLRKLVQRHWKYGLGEMYRGISVGAQVRLLQRYMPELSSTWVQRGPSGVRAQAVDCEGNLVDDFVFDSGSGEFEGRVLHVRNAPSPAATSSLAIARMVVDKLENTFCIKEL